MLIWSKGYFWTTSVWEFLETVCFHSLVLCMISLKIAWHSISFKILNNAWGIIIFLTVFDNGIESYCLPLIFNLKFFALLSILSMLVAGEVNFDFTLFERFWVIRLIGASEFRVQSIELSIINVFRALNCLSIYSGSLFLIAFYRKYINY